MLRFAQRVEAIGFAAACANKCRLFSLRRGFNRWYIHSKHVAFEEMKGSESVARMINVLSRAVRSVLVRGWLTWLSHIKVKAHEADRLRSHREIDR